MILTDPGASFRVERIRHEKLLASNSAEAVTFIAQSYTVLHVAAETIPPSAAFNVSGRQINPLMVRLSGHVAGVINQGVEQPQKKAANNNTLLCFISCGQESFAAEHARHAIKKTIKGQ